MTQAEQLASFIVNASFTDMSGFAVRELKIRVLDSLGCALGALDNELVRRIGDHLDDFGGRAQCTRIGGGRTAPDRAAFFNCALVRYLDFNDSYLAKG
jgi:2-methylcitrate dehydratase